MFENPRRGRQARNCTTNVRKILDLKSSSEKIFSQKLSLGAPVMSPTAVLLNVVVIIAVKQRKELQRASNILLSSMAVTDLLVGSLCVPLSAVVGLLVPYQIVTDLYICKLDSVAISFRTTLAICSIFHLTMIAWERYVAIRKWIDYKVIVTRSRLKKLAIIAWVSARVTVQHILLRHSQVFKFCS